MKRILLLLCALLGTVGTWAIDVKIADTNSGLPSTFGSFSSNVFTTNANSGMAGVTVSGASGLTINEATVNVNHYGYCFSLATSAASTDYRVTLSAPDGYVITGYSMQCSANTSGAAHTLTSEDGMTSVVASAPPYNNPVGPKAFEVTGLDAQTTYFTISTANKGNTLYLPSFTISVIAEGTKIVNVTYNLYDGDSETPIATHEEQAEENSAINIPSTWYNYVAYSDIQSEGTIGSTDCIISVRRTPRTAITDLSNLSNNKAYYIRNERGTWAISGSQMSATQTTNYNVNDANKFVLYNTGEEYYLYSVSEGKFVRSDKSLSRTPEAITISKAENATYPWWFKFDNSHIFNGGNGFMIIDSWSTLDGGNRNYIVEAADFDASIITDLLSGQGLFDSAIEQLKAINFGTGLNQYSFTGEYAIYTSQAETIINGLEAQGYTDENLAAAQTLLANYAINLPTAGFYRIKGTTSGKYLAAGNAGNGKYAMSDAVDATTIFYFDGSILTNLSTGLNNGMNSGSWNWVVGNPSEVTFKDGNTNGGYGILSTNAYFYDNGDGTSSADRGSSASMTDGNLRYRSWQLEAVTSFDFPVNISEAGYATLCAPVALTIPAGVTANTLTLDTNGKTLVLSPVGDAIPAGTPVLIEGPQGSYSFATTDGVPAINAANLLIGTYPAIAAPVGCYVLQNQSGAVGFYQVDNVTPNVRGFRAYIPTQTSPVKAFFFGDTEDAIQSVISGAASAEIYNLAGQRVNKLQRGVNIVNGKKVLVK